MTYPAPTSAPSHPHQGIERSRLSCGGVARANHTRGEHDGRRGGRHQERDHGHRERQVEVRTQQRVGRPLDGKDRAADQTDREPAGAPPAAPHRPRPRRRRLAWPATDPGGSGRGWGRRGAGLGAHDQAGADEHGERSERGRGPDRLCRHAQQARRVENERRQHLTGDERPDGDHGPEASKKQDAGGM